MLVLRSGNVVVDGLKTHFREAGDRRRPTVLLVHDGAFGASALATWQPVIEILADRVHVVAPDLIGYGRSAKVYDFSKDPRRQRLDHLRRFLELAGVTTATVVGNSFGGSLVVTAAANPRLLPQMASGVSFSGTGGPFMIQERFHVLQDYEPSRAAMRTLVESFVTRRDSFMEGLVERRYRASLVPGHLEVLNAPRLFRKPRRSVVRPDLLALLGNADVPMLFVAGADDSLLESGWERHLAAAVPRGRHHRVQSARHQPQLDDPELAAALICDAIKDD